MTKPELVVALDVPSADGIPPLLDRLPSQITWFKIGLQLFTSEGPAVLRYLKERNKRMFLDLKLHDIPNTVAQAVASAARHGVAMLTVHAAGGRDMLRAAAESAGKFGSSAPILVAVTTLTSLNENDLKEIGVSRSLADHTLSLGKLAMSSGMDGLVCSIHEAASCRRTFGDDTVLVTPGIRLEQSGREDQKRVASPEAAVKAGSNFLVVGRPILQATDPHESALEILRRIE